MLRILLILTALQSPAVLAQGEQDEEKEPLTQVAQKKTDENKSKSSKRSSDDYKASEEISEDLSVSYPVDI
ncbi:hypothetical protein [Microbulbifer sp. GL-2]|uniref:hypothetical protein n=1 Tax=Microbulbifer sp. GL-2 TaxID=2591606 RepID=UPI0011627BB0|nr:hypothetical protein [Microbulbifer sp. GL-2]BBM00627.1 hypothetical protein GL2_07010 [Microbulbifer sp. GL-2]